MKNSDLIVDKLPAISNHNSANESPSKETSYSLGGKPVKYFLPPPASLKPFYDTKAGELDTWPAYASRRVEGGQSVALSRDKKLVLLNNSSKGVEACAPKPKFLDDLQRYLQEELRALGVLNDGPSELRLQAYREVFEYLIEDFKTYKSLLSAIKAEYEMMLAHQREQIQELLPLKQMLVTVSERCDQKILVMREEEKQEIIVLKNENKALRKKIEDINRDQVALHVQVERLQDELAAEYLRYRDECDARKLLIADINDLRFQQEESREAAKQFQDDGETERDDPHMLKIALKKAREDEAAATKRLNEMIANYSNVIPMRDFEQLKKLYEQMDEKLDVVKKDAHRLQDEHNALLDVHKQVLQQRDDYYIECETLRRTATPRPNWDRYAEFVEGGPTRWRELSSGKRSDELVDILLKEITSQQGNLENKVEFFDGLGTDDNVPEFLRYDGKVRNRNLSKRDCLLVIKDIWHEKIAADNERNDGHRIDLSTFLLQYLKKRFANDQMATEWAYNIHDSCQRFAKDDRIALFGRILRNEADEELYYSHLQLASDLETRFMKMDVDKGNTGQLTPEDFVVVLKEFFPLKEDSSIDALVKAAEQELGTTDKFQYKELFLEDDEGKTGPFIDELRHQVTMERLKYVDDIKAALVAETGAVNPDQLSKAIKTCDPQVSVSDLNKYVMWAFSVRSLPELSAVETKPLKELSDRLMNGNVKRVGLKPGD